MNSIHIHDHGAPDYDHQIIEYESHAHDILFGMCFEYVRPGQQLLDLGIGTGLASQPFANVGLEVFGLDGSSEMLKVCQAKDFPKALICHDLLDVPLPYSDDSFDHIIVCGVFHFFGDLAPMFREALRIIRPHGILAFTVATPLLEKEIPTHGIAPGYLKMDTSWGVPIFAHDPAYITALLSDYGFELLKRQRFLQGNTKQPSPENIHAVYIAGKNVPPCARYEDTV